MCARDLEPTGNRWQQARGLERLRNQKRRPAGSVDFPPSSFVLPGRLSLPLQLRILLFYFFLFPTSPCFSLCCQIVLTWLFSVTFFFFSSSFPAPVPTHLPLCSCNVCPHAVNTTTSCPGPEFACVPCGGLFRVLRNAADCIS